MTLDTVRERMAGFLRERGVEAVCAWPDRARTRPAGAVAAVSLRSCEGGPAGFRDYLGERWNRESGQWEELYGRRVKLTFGLDLYAARGAEAQAAFDRVAAAFHQEGPDGLKVLAFSSGALEYVEEWRLFLCPAQAVCEGWLCAVAQEDGAFTDFEVRGARI